ncbi:unnamed protein product [Gongylonema pulchrum]|uniref:BSD domain-containing protein n=1 Tax=Gongylonema pulchrum TaxID=637853 RepID=A0A183E9I2_9BILA|nr:unnamed protein product [Gongylonema pulchrum]
MYIPAEDGDEPQVNSTVTAGEADNQATSDEAKKEQEDEVEEAADTTENKENVSADEPSAAVSELDKNSQNDGGYGLGLDTDALEANAAATIEAARKYANSFFSLAKEATAKVATTAEETAKKLQNVVAEKTIIGNLDKEQAKFNEEVVAAKLTLGTLPWSDLPDQTIAKKHILALSLDARNFTRDPPSKTNFDFTHMQSVAAALLEEDPNLRKIRFRLVPKQLSEERFWRNYFYRVSLVRQSALGEQGLPVPESAICTKDVKLARPSESSVQNAASEKDKAVAAAAAEADIAASTNKEKSESEDDSNEAKDAKLKQIRETVASANQKKSGEDWEKELLNDFNDYELVTGQMDKTDEQWEEEIAELLHSA